MIACETLEDEARLREFLPEWRGFLDRVPASYPFQTPQWLLPWWRHFGSGKLHVMVFRHGAETAGVVPAFLHEWEGRRQLTLLGSGISDCLDPVLEPSRQPAILDALAHHLRAFREWDVCDWQDLSAESPLRAMGPAEPDAPCCRIPLDAAFEEFMAARPHDLKRNLRRYAKRARESGPVRFAVTANADPVLLRAFVELHRARWNAVGLPGSIDANRAEAFLYDAAGAMAGADMLRILALYFGEKPSGIILALRKGSTIFGYLSAFDPAYEDVGVGHGLIASALEYAYGEGYKAWDFLRGDEPYKFTWGAEAFPRCRLRFTRERTIASPVGSKLTAGTAGTGLS
jgi:CelD/BcsL family acetyltransferase involved in cellulose biosynthesis